MKALQKDMAFPQVWIKASLNTLVKRNLAEFFCYEILFVYDGFYCAVFDPEYRPLWGKYAGKCI